MASPDLMSQFVSSFITLFVIIDPFSSIPIFFAMTRKKTPEVRFEYAKTAVIVAAVALFVFMLIGPNLFDFIGINLQHFKIAGGVILFIMGLEYCLKIVLPREKESARPSAESVVIGVPMITGPGALIAAVILVSTVGFFVTALAAAAVMAVTFVLLLLAPRVMHLIGETGSEVFSRIMGLLLASLAVNFILSGLDALRVSGAVS